MPIKSVMPSNQLILCHSLLLLPSIFRSIRLFSNESVLCIRWPKYWSFSFNISLSNEYSGLISFMMDWLELFAVQGTLKSLPQHYSSKASIIQCSAFFIVQFSHPYMTTGKTKALTRWTFIGKIMSLLFNMLPRLVITFLPHNKNIGHNFSSTCTRTLQKPIVTLFLNFVPYVTNAYLCIHLALLLILIFSSWIHSHIHVLSIYYYAYIYSVNIYLFSYLSINSQCDLE